LSTGQIPAEFAIPKPDTSMAEASEETDKMETDGQDQEKKGADEQKQEEESTPTPIQEVLVFALYFCLIFHMLPIVFMTASYLVFILLNFTGLM
jgi:hypothetical protein